MTSNRQGRLRVLALIPLFFTAARAVSPAAGAQATRYLVSGVGDDVNLCSRTAPCKTWAGAISKTADGGEINALDSGGFGAVTITKSITLDGNGAHASILACGANGGVTVNTINDPTDKVTLRDLRINGCRGGATVAGTYGVNAVRVGSLRIEDTRIFGFEQAGVRLETNNLKARAVIEDTRIYNNGNYGVLARPAAGTDLRATLHDTRLDDNGNGLVASSLYAPVKARLFDSVVTDSGVDAGSGYGVWATGSTSSVRIGDSRISGNTEGIKTTNGALISYGGNIVDDNGTDGSFTSDVNRK